MANYRSDVLRKERRRNRSKKTSRYHSKFPRLVIYRSLRHFEAQIIDDFKSRTIISVSSRDKSIKTLISKIKNKTEISRVVGEALAKKAKQKKLGPVVLDRNGYPYHGRVKAFADAARGKGLQL